MWPNPMFPADLVKFTEVILNGKLHFLCSESNNEGPIVTSSEWCLSMNISRWIFSTQKYAQNNPTAFCTVVVVGNVSYICVLLAEIKKSCCNPLLFFIICDVLQRVRLNWNWPTPIFVKNFLSFGAESISLSQLGNIGANEFDLNFDFKSIISKIVPKCSVAIVKSLLPSDISDWL